MHTESTESLRLFYALWPDEETRAALAGLQMSVAEGRLTRPQNLHMTLAFLGQQSSSNLPKLRTILSQLPAFETALEFDRIGYFSNKRIAWAGMHRVPDALLELQHDLMAALRQHGIAFDHTTQFKPHVTLARNASAPTEILFRPILWRAHRVALAQSTSQAGGPSYRLLAVGNTGV